MMKSIQYVSCDLLFTAGNWSISMETCTAYELLRSMYYEHCQNQIISQMSYVQNILQSINYLTISNVSHLIKPYYLATYDTQSQFISPSEKTNPAFRKLQHATYRVIFTPVTIITIIQITSHHILPLRVQSSSDKREREIPSPQ